MLIDEINVTFAGGDGGNGKVSFGKMAKSGPDGGNGGKGGDLYVKASSDLTLLNQFSAKPDHEAPNGGHGGKKKMSGKNGEDITLNLPVGTLIEDTETQDRWELKHVGMKIRLCRGGIGGRGNWEFRGPQNTTPKNAEAGQRGEKRRLKLTLKLIADYGLVGFPNAGKSSLLAELTSANPKIANYAFTTLSPNLGVIEGKIIADVPGLIEGAHTGKGLGVRFLKHIEKVGLLLHCISSESTDPLKDYKVIQKELESYNKELLNKKEIVLLTKSDLIDEKEKVKKIKQLEKTKNQVLAISVHDLDSINSLKKLLLSQN
jgi:GTP-binding protein